MPVSLSTLPLEIHRLICSFLSTRDILRLELTDKYQQRRISESGVWRDTLLRWRRDLEDVLGEKMFKCKVVEEMADFLVKNELGKYYKVASGIIRETKAGFSLIL